MTSNAPFTRVATFHARPGRGERLVEPGLTHYRLRPGRNQGWGHRHRAAEEIHVVLSGSGRIKVDDERFELGAWSPA
jgi:mannose-6-phosphate isomerase-like protein (cupin superfamily)